MVKLQSRFSTPFTSSTNWLAVLLCLCVGSGTVSAQPTVVKHYAQGFSPVISEYLTDVLELCLEKTVPAYGPYRVEVHPSLLSTNRSKLETERGQLLDVLFATNWLHQRPDPDRVIAVDFPVFFGTLGIRSLIIDKHTEIARDDAKSFKQMRAGQGLHWIDGQILRANGIKVVEAQTFASLFPMVQRNRFDYLPLSVLEAQQTLAKLQFEYPTLTIDKNIQIFYPLPVYLYINAERTDLVERFTEGLRLAQESGALAELFQTHFKAIDDALRQGNRQIIVLNNPFSSPEQDQQIIQTLRNRYPQEVDLIYLQPR